MSLLNAWLLKRFRRRPLIMVSSLGMAVCMFLSGLVTLWIKQGKLHTNAFARLQCLREQLTKSYCFPGNKDLSWIPVMCLLLYVCCSMLGLLTIPWTMTAELFPADIRGIAHSLSYSMANLLMFFAIKSYQYV